MKRIQLLTPIAQRVSDRCGGNLFQFRETFASDKAFFEWAFGKGSWKRKCEHGADRKCGCK